MKDEIREKARKLLALADPSRGAGVEEAHTAWVKLHALLLNHGASLEEVVGNPGNRRERGPVAILSFDLSMPSKDKMQDGKWYWHGRRVAEVLGIPVPDHGYCEITEWQRNNLDRYKILWGSVRTTEAAEAIITDLGRRSRLRLASASQCCWIAEMGYEDVDFDNLGREEAGQFFER